MLENPHEIPANAQKSNVVSFNKAQQIKRELQQMGYMAVVVKSSHGKGWYCVRYWKVQPEHNPSSFTQIMVTAPHALIYENPDDDHPFDWIATDMAKALSEALGAEGPLLSPIQRDFQDQNRPPSRDSPYRIEIRHRIQRSCPVLLIDVHSYPPDSESPYRKYDAAPLYIGPENMGEAFLLAGEMRRMGLKSGALPATAPNDVVIEAKELGVPYAVLIEFNERWKGNERILAQKVAQAVRSSGLC